MVKVGNRDPVPLHHAVSGRIGNVFSGSRRLAGRYDDLVRSHRFDLGKRLNLRPLRDRQHCNHAADSENNTERSQNRPDFMKHQVVKREPQLIVQFHYWYSCV